MAESQSQYLRKCTLVVSTQLGEGIDLSAFKVRFLIQQSDVQSPGNARIRVYNLSDDTIQKITRRIPVEYTRVTLSAGYEQGAFGNIFDGTIKQYYVGRESNITSFIDFLAADGDIAYNFAVIAASIKRNSTPGFRVNAGLAAANIPAGNIMQFSGGILPRGKVLFGMWRDSLRDEVRTQNASWSIQDGKVNVIPLDGFLPGEVLVVNSQTGMVGIPEQTDQGIRVRVLLNPRVRIGAALKLNNKDINQINKTVANGTTLTFPGQVPFNQYSGISYPASINADGLYRVFVAEHAGDTRGNEWYTDITCLSIDPSSETVAPYG